MTRVACTLMQKNEDLLLEAWLTYHGHLFGYENLFVFDNGSNLTSVIDTLIKFEKRGVSVFWDRNSAADYELKGHIIGDLVNGFKAENRYDLVVPLDCDEFFAISGRYGISTDRDEILGYLDSIGDTLAAPDMFYAFTNWPGHLDLFIVANFEKSIIPVRNFREIDLGFHQVLLLEPHGRFRSNAFYFHLHHKPLEAVRRNAREKLKLRLDLNDPEAVRTFHGVGTHLIRYLSMTHESYCDSVANRFPLAATRSLEGALKRLGVHHALQQRWRQDVELYERGIGERAVVPLDGRYDREAYLRRYPDIAAADMDPLLHYVYHGYLEGRTMV